MKRALVEQLTDFFSGKSATGVVSAYLFGSYAQAHAHRESDIDVAVLLDRDVYATDRERFETRLRLIGELGSHLERSDIDLVVLNDVSPELGARVITDGVRVFCADEDTDHAFVRDVQLLAADLRPFLERMRRIKLKAMKR